MRLGFVTCVSLGLACMEEIERVGGHLDLVVTLEDDLARGKSGRVWVDHFCRHHGAALTKVRSINDAAAVETIEAHQLDWLFIIGWSQIAKPRLLAAPTRGVLGMHPTLLPTGRGRASIPWAIIKGLEETGVTLFMLDEGVDTGPILAQERVPLAPRETATTLYDRVQTAHRTLIARSWDDLMEDRLEPTPQNEELATVWPGRTPEDGRIDPAMSVDDVDRLVRATTHPYPGAFWEQADGCRMRIWAGRPLESQAAAYSAAAVLQLADGAYEPVEYEIETRRD